MMNEYLDRYTVQVMRLKIAGPKVNRMLKKAGLKTRWKIYGFSESEFTFKTAKNRCTLPNKK